jgi:hypothetical protein
MREVGASVGLSPNGQKALQAISPAALTALQQKGGTQKRIQRYCSSQSMSSAALHT